MRDCRLDLEGLAPLSSLLADLPRKSAKYGELLSFYLGDSSPASLSSVIRRFVPAELSFNDCETFM